ncbi:MAG: cellulase family glycosylhydrolase [Planctomycetaceae bacterium]
MSMTSCCIGQRSFLLSCIALQTALVASSAAAPPRLERVVVSEDGSHFVTVPSGERLRLWGVNYDHDDEGRLIEDYWHDEWETVVEDFGEIRALGGNVVRIHLQVGRFLTAPDKANAENLSQLTRLVELADSASLYLNLTGLGCYHSADVPAWYNELDEAARWRAQAFFWTEVAKACDGHPAVFCYDLMNEPIIGGNPEQQGWTPGELGGKHFVQRLTLTPGDRSREEIAAAWVKQLTSAIREVDDKTLITVGVIPWAHVFPKAKPLFYGPQVGEPLDFVSVHFYPKQGEVQQALDALAVYQVGKPLVVEETFPLSCSLEEQAEFIERAGDEIDGWISFYWGKTIEENRAAGDLKGAIIASWLEWLRERATTR